MKKTKPWSARVASYISIHSRLDDYLKASHIFIDICILFEIPIVDITLDFKKTKFNESIPEDMKRIIDFLLELPGEDFETLDNLITNKKINKQEIEKLIKLKKVKFDKYKENLTVLKILT